MSYATKLARLRVLLHDMEKELGLTTLSPVERDLIYVIEELHGSGKEVQTHQILKHDLLSSVSRPTIFRAISSLLERGYISRGESLKKGFYTIAEEHQQG